MLKYCQRVIVLVSASLVFTQPLLSAPHPTENCSTEGIAISKTFSSGATWDLCAAITPDTGLTLAQVYYAAPGQIRRRILGEASLSQLETVFDDNSAKPEYVVTDLGLGANNSLTLTDADCPGGSLHMAVAGRNTLCTRSEYYGHQYKQDYDRQFQGQFFELSAVSAPDSRIYTLRWRLYENGMIEPGLGMSGYLPGAREGIVTLGSFTDHAGWRLDFDLGEDPTNDGVEEITSTPTPSYRQKDTAINTISSETGRLMNPEIKRFWRIRDGAEQNANGRPISYEIIPSQYHHSRGNIRTRPWLQNDIYFSRYAPCERHASRNPAQGGCAGKKNLQHFVDDQADIESEDIVIWYKQSYHYLPRNPNNNAINTVWSTFQLLPRDWYASNPF